MKIGQMSMIREESVDAALARVLKPAGCAYCIDRAQGRACGRIASMNVAVSRNNNGELYGFSGVPCAYIGDFAKQIVSQKDSTHETRFLNGYEYQRIIQHRSSVTELYVHGEAPMRSKRLNIQYSNLL
jgi:hypothetical protein